MQTKLILKTTLVFLICTLGGCQTKPKDDYISDLERISNKMYYHFNEANADLDSLKLIIPKKDLHKYKAYFNTLESFKSRTNGDYITSLNYADSALTYFMWEKNIKWQAKCLQNLAFTAECLYLDKDAIDYYTSSAQLFKNTGLKGISTLGIARSKQRLGHKWEISFEEGIKLLNESNQVEHHLYSKTVPYWFDIKNCDITSNLKDAALQYDKLKMWKQSGHCHKLLSSGYFKEEKYDSSLIEINLAIDKVLQEDNHSNCLASLLSFKGNILLKVGKIEDVKVEINKTIVLYEEQQLENMAYYAYLKLSNIYTDEKNYELANKYSRKALDSYIMSSNVKKSTSALLTKIRSNRSYIENELRKIRVRHYLKIVLIILVILGLTIVTVYSYKKKAKQQQESINSLKVKNQVLGYEKNELLGLINKLENEIDTTQTTKDLKRIIMKDPELDNTLPDLFYASYHRYIVRIKILFPTLTESEVKSAVMFSMNIPQPTIAKLLFIQPETVKKYRSRIRKKLNLDTHINLMEFLEEKLTE